MPFLARSTPKVRIAADRVDLWIAVSEHRPDAAMAAAERHVAGLVDLHGDDHPLTLRARLESWKARVALGQSPNGDLAALARRIRSMPSTFPPQSVVHRELAQLGQ